MRTVDECAVAARISSRAALSSIIFAPACQERVSAACYANRLGTRADLDTLSRHRTLTPKGCRRSRGRGDRKKCI